MASLRVGPIENEGRRRKNSYKVVDLVSGGSIINGATPSSFLPTQHVTLDDRKLIKKNLAYRRPQISQPIFSQTISELIS